MSVLRVASRYALSLFELATEKGIEETITGDAKAFVLLCETNRDFHLMLKSPVVNVDKKWSILNKVFGGSFNPMTMSFIKIVLRKRRDTALETIFKQYLEYVMEQKGIVAATVFTASPVSDKIVEELKTFLAKQTSSQVELDTKVNPDLMGGFVLQYEDKMLDASVASQLRKLRKQLMSEN